MPDFKILQIINFDERKIYLIFEKSFPNKFLKFIADILNIY